MCWIFPVKIEEHVGLRQEGPPVSVLLVAQLGRMSLVIRRISRPGKEVGLIEHPDSVGKRSLNSLDLFVLER
jgi:hypothetical protein